MQIKISSYEVEEAILDFVNKKYGHSFEISKHDPHFEIESNERVWVYRKHKNGKVKINPESGFRQVDHELSTWRRTFKRLEECDDITFYVKELDDES